MGLYCYSCLFATTVTETTLIDSKDQWILQSKSTKVAIRKADGMMQELINNNPTSLSIIPKTGAMRIYLKYSDQHSGINCLIADKLISSRVQTEDGYPKLTCQVNFSDSYIRDNIVVTLTYVLKDNLLTIRTEVQGGKDGTLNYLGLPDVGFGQGYDQSQWDRHWYAGLYFDDEFDFGADLSEAIKPRLLQFDMDFNDNIHENDWADSYLQMPVGYLERQDRYMMWGSLDLGRFMVLAPNYQQLMPSFLFRPRNGLEKKTLVFDTFIKFFSKDDYNFTTMYRWYAQHVYSTNPITQGIVTMPKDAPYRTVPAGNIGGISMINTPWGSRGKNNQDWKRLEDVLLQVKGIHHWFGDWQTWDGRLPTEGTWMPAHTDGTPVEAEQLKRYIAERHQRGFKFYAYMRQLFANGRMYEDVPPYLHWMKIDRNGQYIPYNTGNLEDYRRGWENVSDEEVKRYGIDRKKFTKLVPHGKMGWLYADFDNPQFRKWYIERTKALIEYYDFDGISWDMAWFDIHRGIHHGILRVQYEIYTWLQQNHPDKKILSNMSQGNPSQLYTDIVFYEGTDWASKQSQIEVGLAYQSAINGYIGYSDLQKCIDEIRKCLGMGLTWFVTDLDSLDSPIMGLAKLTDLVDFSAQANSLPAITDFQTIVFSNKTRTILANVWGQGEQFLLAAFADDDDADLYTTSIKVDKNILNNHHVNIPKALVMKIIGTDGFPKKENDFVYTNNSEKMDYLEFTGTLRPNELLLVTTQ